MPELPEVETIKLGLQKYIVGLEIDQVEVKLPRIFSGDTKNIIGAAIQKVERFGKGLVIELDNGYSIAIHIKLTGQLVFVSNKLKNQKVKIIKGTFDLLPSKWTHIIFKLKAKNLNLKKEAGTLYYNDFRQFGWLKIIKSEDVQKDSFFKTLGPEFFKDLTKEKFKNIIKNSKTNIKVLVMDQKKISGLGNIYANDGLFNAKINPLKKASDLSDLEIERLYDSFLDVLKKGLKEGGASELSYVNALGEEGSYQKYFLVYARDKKPCLICKTPIQKIKLGGRGTYFCPNCQK